MPFLGVVEKGSGYAECVFESLDWVFDELYEERWSERYDVDVRAGVARAGVLVALLYEDPGAE